MHAVGDRGSVACGDGVPGVAAPDLRELARCVHLTGFSGHDCHDGGHAVVTHTRLFYGPGLLVDEKDTQ